MSTDPTRGPIPEGRESNFVFPTEYPLKVAGKNSTTLETVIVEIVQRHVADFDSTTVTVRESKGGKYLAVSLSFTAHSKTQLDALYSELTQHPEVLWAL
jgi:uncharacterized protein